MHPFTVLFTLATLGALIWLGLAQTRHGPRSGPLDAGLAALAGSLVGARGVFVAAHLDYYRAAIVEAIWFWQGGMSAFGAVLGAVIALRLYSHWSDGRFWRLADRLVLPAHLPAFAAWLGCLLEGCAYGIRLSPSTWVPASPDLVGTLQPRWPTQSTGALATLFGFLIVIGLRRRSPAAGTLAAAALVYHGAVLLALSMTRADPVPIILGLRSDAVGGAGLIALGAAPLLLQRVRS